MHQIHAGLGKHIKNTTLEGNLGSGTIDLLQDSGFQGFKPKNTNIIQPLKKPKGKELTDEQKQQNKDKSKIRVVVEHSIRGVKIWRIAKDVCRT